MKVKELGTNKKFKLVSIEKENRTPNQSLCWSCQNAVPTATTGCCWSRHFKPVEGWEATPNPNPEMESFRVKKCPCFKEETDESREGNLCKYDSACVRLVEHILKSEIQHYRDTLNQYAKAPVYSDNRSKVSGELRTIERDLCSEVYANLTMRLVDMRAFCNQLRREYGIEPMDEYFVH